jgi:SAM-dependent methyltransferase
MTGYFISFLDVKPDSDVVELGCGSGAFLKQLPPCRSLSGCDYSASAVAHAAEVHRGGDFRIGEAARSPFPDASFDRVLSFGVTHYFDSLQYMTSVLEEMWRLARPGAVLFVGDIDDAAHQDEMEAFRNQHSAARQAQYVAGTAEIDHLYIPQSVFSDFAKSKNIKCQFIDQRGPELAFYYNSAYRYSVVLRKP